MARLKMLAARKRETQSSLWKTCYFCSWESESGNRRVLIHHLRNFHLISSDAAITSLLGEQTARENGKRE